MRSASVAAFVLIATFASVPANAAELLVSAASSLTEAMRQIGRDFEQANPGVTVRFNFAASGLLQRQIENGAPVDVFVSAGSKEMDALARGGLIEGRTRADIAGNSLVLIVGASSRIRDWANLAGPGVRRVAISNPDSVPSGRFARETLQKRHIWDTVRRKAVLGQNVRQTLAYVARGDADAGIVFASDALIERARVRVVATGSPQDHSPILYPAAVVSRSRLGGSARRFVAFLQTPGASNVLVKHGFTKPPVRQKAAQ